MTRTDTTKVSPIDQDVAVEDVPDPAALPTKKTYSVTEKLKFLADYEALGHGEKGAFLRANALYSSQLTEWRRQRDAGTLGAPRHSRSENREVERLTRKNKQLEDELERTRLALDIVGKARALLETLSKSADTE
jgi:transposase